MPSERAYLQANGRAVAVGRTTPGTPRKEPSGSRSRDRNGALQDPGLKDYRLGDCIGKGAFGSVYKAFNWGTGEAVAVKQIKLADLPRSELRMIEAEIDLLKNLHHDNIVKYIGFVKSTDCLNIILEYCENGSLHSICKVYGKFPENLVGVYMTQVLQGLQYLHDQGVIHRDIKGANILTTKDGTVKLADFGVSTSTLSGQDKEAQVVGTPYWMAPEIIQLSGATSASDIWSVGCTVIELLQGKPPYHNLAPMPALFAIVNDDHPPLPEGVSPAARDFLMQCFQKDPNLRVSARKLARHAWTISSRRSDAPVSKRPAEAVEEVVRWNKALESSEYNLRASTGSDGGPAFNGNVNTRHQGEPVRQNMGAASKGPLALKPRSMPQAFRSPEQADDDNWDNDFATAISPSALQLPHLKPQDNFAGMLSADKLKAFASIDDSRNIASFLDEPFEGELLTIKPRSMADLDLQEQTIRPLHKKPSKEAKSPKSSRRRGHKATVSHSSIPSKSPTKPSFGSKFEIPARPEIAYREQSVEDYSDLFDSDDNTFARGPKLVVKVPSSSHGQPHLRRAYTAQDSPQLFHPSDLTSLPRSASKGGSLRRQRPSSTRPPLLPERQFRRTRSSVEIERYAEKADDEDFSDIFGPSEHLTEKEESVYGSENGELMLLSKLSNNSWLGDDEDEDDPFAMMDPGWDEMDLEANIARDRHARLAEKVEELVRSLKTSESDDILSQISQDMLTLLWENTEVKDLIISAHGLLPILEILEPRDVKSHQTMILQLLKIVNAIILDDVELQENLCFVGGIPIITRFAERRYSNEIRMEAAAFVRQMYQTSTTTLQMFVSCGGLNVLAEFLDEDYDTSRELVLIGVNGIWNVFELQGPTPKNDFCRIFSRNKILDPLAVVLHKVLEEETDDFSELVEGRIVNIFYLFSQAENYVKEVVADRQVLKTVLKDLRRMTPLHQVTMLKFIKNLSMLSTTLESLHSADAIEFLIDVLSQSMKKDQQHFREISNQILNTMFNLCRLSKERQESAAANGIIPLLMKIMQTDRPPKEFVLPILCDMAHSSPKARRHLWAQKGLDFYVSLLADQYWQVTAIDAIHIWLQDETAKVENHLFSGKFTEAIASCFNAAKVNFFDPNILEPLVKILRLSPRIAATLARPDMYAGITPKLSQKKAIVRLNLLRVLREIMDNCSSDRGITTSTGSRQLRALFDLIQTFAEKDPAVLVRNLAAELVKTHIESEGDSVSTRGGEIPSNISSAAASRSRSGPRRSTSYTPPGLSSSMSAPPMTPTHGHRHTQSSAFIEVASSAPRRTAVAMTHERDAALHRPRSRDGASASSSIPRRVSGDMTANGTKPPAAGGSRLPRQSTNLSSSTRPSLNPAIVSRSESSMSNKENVTRHSVSGGAAGGSGRERERVERTTAAASHSQSHAQSKRRPRAPSGESAKWPS